MSDYFFLQIKYLLAVRLDLSEPLLRRAYPSVLLGLCDTADDVVGVAAAALLPVVHALLLAPPTVVDLPSLTDRLWSALDDLDDITGSTHSVMQLLAEIVKQQADGEAADLSFASEQTQVEAAKLSQRVPRLFPFLSHPSTLVRKAALRTLDTLTSQRALAQAFLPSVIKPLTTHLFQRALLEENEDSLTLIERVWSNACDLTPLGPLLMSTCPQYGNWVTLITQPPNWPLPPQLLLNSSSSNANNSSGETSSSSNHQYLGGPNVQHVTDAAEKDFYATRARMLGSRLLGKLAGFIVRPVPGMDYSKDALPPLEMFVQKILLPNLLTNSAYRRTALCLVIGEWSDQHDGVRESAPQSLKDVLNRFLTEAINYEETIAAFTQLQTDVGDFIATLKHYKLKLPSEEIGKQCYKLTFEQIRLFLTTTDFRAVISSNNKVKPKVADSILERWQCSLTPAMNQILTDQSSLAVMTLAAAAGAAAGVGAIADKLNPVIKPLMEAVKKERNKSLQALSARRLAQLLELCSGANASPADKVVKNLVSFVCADPSTTPPPNTTAGIVTLKLRESQSANAGKGISNSNKRNGSNPAAAAAKEFKQQTGDFVSASSVNNAISSSSNTDSDPGDKLGIQTRGAQTALVTIVRHFGESVFERLPKLRGLTLGALDTAGTQDARSPAEMVYCLRALQVSNSTFNHYYSSRISA